jgi:hypothetical protein
MDLTPSVASSSAAEAVPINTLIKTTAFITMSRLRWQIMLCSYTGQMAIANPSI